MSASTTPVIGIDLGTTYSEVAIVRDGKVEIVREDGDAMLPSCVGLTPDGQLLVGHAARNQYLVYPERTIRSIKRSMGSSERVPLGDKAYLPQEISAMILRELKARAERSLGQPVSQAVITVPAYFSDAQRQATREAGQLAGLDVLRIVNEPTAACLAYENAHPHQAKTVLAYDLGGGTFDVSIVKFEGDLVEVIASHGDNHLGGDDFDELLYQNICERLAAKEDREVKLGEVAHCRLRRAAELAKIRLSDEPFARVIEDHLQAEGGELAHLDEEVAREEFTALIAPLLDKTIQAIHKALRDAKLTPRHLDEVVLVGGSSRIPAVVDLIERELGLTPRRDVHPDLAVALGAGVMAARLAGSSDQRVLVEITPYTFGISALGWVGKDYGPFEFSPIIKGGSPLPISRSEAFYTTHYGQKQVDVTVFQGEHHDARRNILIGRFQFDGLDQKAPEGSLVLIHMQLDLDGILRVTATEKATGLQCNATIENTLGKLTHEQLQNSRREIAALFGDKAETPAEISPPNPEEAAGDELAARVRSALDQMDPVDREDAERLLDKLREASEANDDKAIAAVLQELDDLLFYIES